MTTMKQLLEQFAAREPGDFAGLREEPGPAFSAELITTLERRRVELELTKGQLAERLGVSPARVTEWTTGKVVPGLTVVGQWLAVLGLTAKIGPAPAPATINPQSLSRAQLAAVVAAAAKSRRAGKSELSRYADARATAADLDAVLRHAERRGEAA